VNLLDHTRAVLARAIDVYGGTEHRASLAEIRQRIDEPLRVAIAGRVKAGKSTLLNAMVGERLAPTDAGECTRIVTWYRDGHTYRVLAYPRGQAPRQLRFTREDGAIQVDLDGMDRVERLEVTWPSQELRTTTLIDTPGIGSLSESVSRHTWRLLAAADEETPADAVIYLMRHVHRSDIEFLRAFHDTEVSQPNAINAIGVLSRADEIGAGRLDYLASARQIANRTAAEPDVRRVVQTVVPVAGLLAETAATLTESEVEQLRLVAALPAREADGLLLSADRFATADTPELPLAEPERRALLGRFGLLGLRIAVILLRRGKAATATELARLLAERSGIGELRSLLGSLFFERRDVLKSRSALLALDALTRVHPRAGSGRVAAAVEELIASAHPFRELRVLSAMRAGWIDGKPELLADLERVIGGSGSASYLRLEVAPDAAPGELAAAAAAALERWQRRAEHPLSTYELAMAARVAVRSCEGMLADLNRSAQGVHARS
jgi:energy-coupling factor transporter ATP-binding protein EcfA2